MKWDRIGQIFEDPHGGFAQSPQGVPIEDGIRVYYSYRVVEPSTGKYLSHIAYLDFTCRFAAIKGRSAKQVIKLGATGCFDEHGIFPMNVLKHSGRIMAYTTGWSRRVSVQVETSIGFAESFDGGKTFEKLGDGPVLTNSLHEPFLVADAFVQHINGCFHMWYIHGTHWIESGDQPERVYKIAHATSDDGLHWIKENRQIVQEAFPDECQALPTVIRLGGSYHMVFCYRHATDFRTNKLRGYRLGYARSGDLVNWTRDDNELGIDLSETGWDSEMMCYPHLMEADGEVFLLYNGNQFGRYGFGAAVLREV